MTAHLPQRRPPPEHVRLFISEYLTSGACPDVALDSSLAIEGQAMMGAVLNEAMRCPGLHVTTTWDRRLYDELVTTWDYRHGDPPSPAAGTHLCDGPAMEQQLFRQLVEEAEAVLVIAPEFGGILEERCRIVEAAGRRLVGPSSAAVRLCADKLRLAEHLQQAGVTTIPTAPLNIATAGPGDLPFDFPCVIKPRNGAGSQETYLITGTECYKRLQPEMAAGPLLSAGAIVQPFIKGYALSVALIRQRGRPAHVMPVCTQKLSDDGRFRYRGGSIPAYIPRAAAVSIQEAARQACRTITGLLGYVGIDVILPYSETEKASPKPVIVEINPRLTTSFVMYAGSTVDNLVEAMLFPHRFGSRMMEFTGAWDMGADGFMWT